MCVIPHDVALNLREIGFRLRDARLATGLTAAQVSLILKIPEPRINLIEQGARKMSVAELCVLACLYQLSTDYILWGDDQN